MFCSACMADQLVLIHSGCGTARCALTFAVIIRPKTHSFLPSLVLQATFFFFSLVVLRYVYTHTFGTKKNSTYMGCRGKNKKRRAPVAEKYARGGREPPAGEKTKEQRSPVAWAFMIPRVHWLTSSLRDVYRVCWVYASCCLKVTSKTRLTCFFFRFSAPLPLFLRPFFIAPLLMLFRSLNKYHSSS